MLNAIRSIVFTILMFITAFIASVLCLLTFWMPYEKRYPYLVAWPKFMVWLAKHLCGINYVVKGKENIPKDNAIIVCNHQSTWETLAFFALFPHACFVLKHELLMIPVFGWGLRLLEPIAINRKNSTGALEQVIKQGTERLKQNRCIAIFAEGHRMPVGQLGKFKIGAAKLAIKTASPIIPVAHDAGKYWRRRGLIKKPGTITVTIGTAIAPDGMNAAALTNSVRDVIAKSLRAELDYHVGQVSE